MQIVLYRAWCANCYGKLTIAVEILLLWWIFWPDWGSADSQKRYRWVYMELEITMSIHVPGTPLKWTFWTQSHGRFGVHDFPFEFGWFLGSTVDFAGCIHFRNPPEITHLYKWRWLFQIVGMKQWQQNGSCFQRRWFFPKHLFLESEHGQTLLPYLVTTSTSYNMSQNSHSQIQWWVQHLFFVDRILLSRTSQSNVRDINVWYVQTRKSCQRREFSAGKLGSWEVWKLGSPNSRVSKGNKTNARKDRRMTYPEAQHGVIFNDYHRCSNNLSRFEGPTRTD